jgi:hypothetical protein
MLSPLKETCLSAEDQELGNTVDEWIAHSFCAALVCSPKHWMVCIVINYCCVCLLLDFGLLGARTCVVCCGSASIHSEYIESAW